MRLILLSLALFAATPVAAAADTKHLADALIRQIRAQQQPDWTFGSGLEDTARVLDLLTRSPRRYNELDGPFFRRAAERVARARPGELADGWRVLALASAITPELVEARQRALDRLRQRAAEADGRVDLLALRTFAEAPLPSPAPGPDAEAAVALLLADEPADVPAPPLDQPLAWARWARAARLVGLELTEPYPPLPAAEGPGAPGDLPGLLDALEQVVAQHGLERAPPADSEPPPPLPEIVDQPRELVEALAASAAWFDAHQEQGTFGLGLPGWVGPEPGITALALSARLAISQLLGEDPPAWTDQGLDYLAGLQRPDGSIQLYGVAVYTTSAAMGALIDGGREQDQPVVARAREFLLMAQADEGEGYVSGSDPHYGGIGYGGDERPDLSNTQFALEAAWRADPDADPEFYEKAMEFLVLNHNAGELGGWSRPRPGGGTLVTGTDGGATYMPGNSPAGEDQLGEGTYSARSYGSMTYALTKSFLICGLDPYGDRVQAAVRWIVRHYTLETNPGFSNPAKAADGLYYYYLAMARTLRLVPDDLLIREDGSQIDWRVDLTERLLSQQRTDGSWINEASARWMEGGQPLCTAYAVLALAAAES